MGEVFLECRKTSTHDMVRSPHRPHSVSRSRSTSCTARSLRSGDRLHPDVRTVRRTFSTRSRNPYSRRSDSLPTLRSSICKKLRPELLFLLFTVKMCCLNQTKASINLKYKNFWLFCRRYTGHVILFDSRVSLESHTLGCPNVLYKKQITLGKFCLSVSTYKIFELFLF